jgi:enhancing lycopene biosynthesis protein 2
MSKILVLLSGSGKNDGSEIHESVLALLAIDQEGVAYDICAPEGEQADVVNHQNDEVMSGEKRNMQVEAARIARGPVLSAGELSAEDYGALVIPGGFGAAKNLCSFASEGADCRVHPAVEKLLRSFHEKGKVIGAICIAPALVARVLGQGSLTIGNDRATAKALETMGACHVPCEVSDIVVDEERNLVSTPAYMLGTRISQVQEGIAKLIKEVIRRSRREELSA